MQGRLLPSVLMLVVGICVGRFGLPLLYGYSQPSTLAMQATPSAITRSVVACELSSEQIDHLASRIAPSVVKNLATSGLGNIAIDPKIAAQQRQAGEQDKAEKASALAQATRLIDQMVSNHQVTPQGMRDAEQLLQQTGQADQIYLLHGRIAVAVNKGNLTLAQAGLRPSISPE
jgi:uncharacterized membrane protein YdfJ with MMPL/SSD domain